MVFDLHNDILTSGLTAKYIKSVVKNNTSNKVCYVFWTSKLKEDTALGVIKKAFRGIRSVTNKDFFAIEDLHFLRAQDVFLLAKIPILYCGLTWNYSNALAGGAYSDGILTQTGKDVITELNNNNIIIDTAHLNSSSFYQVVEKADRVINSHTAINELTNHLRNLNSEQIKLIIQKNGIIGLTLVKDFIGGNSINHYIEQIDYFCERYNINNLCIGTDFYGATPIEGLQKYDDFDIIKYRLGGLGYTSENIDKIFYKNANEFIYALRRNKCNRQTSMKTR